MYAVLSRYIRALLRRIGKISNSVEVSISRLCYEWKRIDTVKPR